MITGQTTSIRIYNAIKQSCLSIPEVKHFGLWNNQVEKLKEGEKNAIRFPAIFVQFENQYNQLSTGSQSIDGTFVLYLCLQSLKFKDEDILLWKDYLYQQLSKELPKNGFANFERRFDVQDVDYDNLFIWQMEFSYQFTDDVASDVMIPLHPFSIQTDVEYQNPLE